MTSGQKRAATKRKRSKKQGVGGKPTIVKSVLVLKSDDADYNLYFGGHSAAGHYDPLSDTVNVNLASILPIGRSMGFNDEDADKYTANVLSRLNAHEFGHAITDGQPGVGNLRLNDYGPYSKDLSATARIEHPANILQYPESSLTAHRELLRDLNAHQYKNAGVHGILADWGGQRVGEDHPMRGITDIMQQLMHQKEHQSVEMVNTFSVPIT